MGFGFQNILKSVDPVGKQLFQPKEEGGAGLSDFLNLYGYGAAKPGGQATAATQQPIPQTLIQPTPVATSTDQRVAQRKSLADQLSRKGRASTILSQDTLGTTG